MTARFRLLALVLASLVSVSAFAQGGPPPHVRAAIQAVEHMIDSTDDASIQALVDKLDPAYKAAFTPEKLDAHLRSLRAAVGGSIGAVSVERDPDGLRLNVEGKHEATFRLVVDPSGTI